MRERERERRVERVWVDGEQKGVCVTESADGREEERERQAACMVMQSGEDCVCR